MTHKKKLELNRETVATLTSPGVAETQCTSDCTNGPACSYTHEITDVLCLTTDEDFARRF